MREFAAVVATLALLTACGGGGSGQPAGSHQVSMSEFHFEPGELTVTHGKVVFWLVNSGNLAHDMVIRDSSGTRVAMSELVSSGDSKEFDVDNLAAGSYTFFCDQPGHETSGMKGTLTAT